MVPADAKGVGRKIFSWGAVRIDLVLTTKNGKIIKIWMVK